MVSHFDRAADDEQPARHVARNAVQHALRLPELQTQLRGTGAAHVQLQQPLRRLSGVRRAGLPRARSIPTWCCPIASLSLAERRDRALEGDRPAGSAAGIATSWPTLSRRPGVDWTTPLAEWKPKARRAASGRATASRFSAWPTLLEKQYVTATDPATRERLEAFRGSVACPACGGARLRPEARSVPPRRARRSTKSRP